MHESSLHYPGPPPPEYSDVGTLTDNGAEVSFLLKLLAKQVSIIPYKYQVLELIPFSADRGKIAQRGIAIIELMLKSGESFFMDLFLVQFICKSIRRVAIDSGVKDLCDTLPRAHEVFVPECYKDIGLLIGSDYF